MENKLNSTVKTAAEEYDSLIQQLKSASDAYYNGQEIMSNYEYDRMYERLQKIEEETGIVRDDSPTKHVGAEVENKLPKVVHEFHALSLDKTQDIDKFYTAFETHLNSDKYNLELSAPKTRTISLEYKLDGCTLQATYDNGKLSMLATRGNGEIGSDVSHNAKYVDGLPLTIAYKGHLVIRGECLMSYEEFDRINSSCLEADKEEYANARNLANATITLIDNDAIKTRKIEFKAFELVYKDDDLPYKELKLVNALSDNQPILYQSFTDRLNWLQRQGFGVVKFFEIKLDKLKEYMQDMENHVQSYPYPVDGLVAVLNDRWYAEDFPSTDKHPHIMRGYAFKWKDETKQTVLRDIEWSASMTGLLNPVAVFDSVDLEGTTVSRASVHNVSYIVEKDLRIGDNIEVLKANKIIPQIAKNNSFREINGDCKLHAVPRNCPVCGAETKLVKSESGTIVLMCSNDNCMAKRVGKFVRFCDRDGMNILGMSESTILKLINNGFLSDYIDFFKLDKCSGISKIEGLGEKSWKNMVKSAEAARHCKFVNFMHALGVPNIGKGQAKMILNYINKEYRKNYDAKDDNRVDSVFVAFCRLIADGFDFTKIDGIGKVVADSIHSFFDDMALDIINDSENTWLGILANEVEFVDEWKPIQIEDELKKSEITDKTFVITGELQWFQNRDALKEKIEEYGGKVAGSVSKKTDFLINNDSESESAKNKKAKELGIRIITEEEFLKLLKN